jgi:hypothetical protein
MSSVDRPASTLAATAPPDRTPRRKAVIKRGVAAVPPPTHPRAGTNSYRQSVGLPGHCERCAEVGHVRAHRTLGCGDVGCTAAHSPGDPSDQAPPRRPRGGHRPDRTAA